ncbi:MAG: glycosyltransferase [Clostridia bacterium]|nr:glycosyltransferase [Clostridia bacterium]
MILTCNTGGGHNSAALALESYFQEVGVECDIADFLGFGKSFANNIICNGHVFIYRHAPKLFEWGYKKAESDTQRGENSIIYKYCSAYADNLYKFLQMHKYDCIISVHIFATIALDYIKKHMDSRLFACHVSTDYTCYPEISNTDLDCYFIAHKALIEEHSKNGMQKNKLIPSGIPIRDIFYKKASSKEDAKKKIGVSPAKKMILLAGGSMGCGPMEEITELLLEKLGDAVTIAVICGSNEAMYENLSVYDKLHLRGFVTNINQYMQAADVLLTKAGGLTITEAAASNLPLVFINAVSGCESYNRDFFKNNGYALASISVEEVADNAIELLENEKMLKTVTERMNTDFSVPASKIIYEKLAEVVDNA